MKKTTATPSTSTPVVPDVALALESLSALSRTGSTAAPSASAASTSASSAAGASTSANATATTPRASRRRASPPNSSSSTRSQSPPSAAVRGSRLHLHLPSTTPPRLMMPTGTVSGTSILQSVQPSKKHLFTTPRTEVSASTKSAATAAFIAAQEKAKRGAPGTTPAVAASASSATGTHLVTLGYDSRTLPAGSDPASHSPPPQTPAALSSSSHHPPPPPSAPLIEVVPSTMKQASKRPALEAALLKCLHTLSATPRHASSTQFHLVAGLLEMRKGQWARAEWQLRRADELYEETVKKGSKLARYLSSSAAGGKDKSDEDDDSLPPTQESGPSDDIDLTQPTPDDAAGTKSVSPSPSQSSQSAAQRSAFVSRKAAEIKLCRAIATWKRAWYGMEVHHETSVQNAPSVATTSTASGTKTEAKEATPAAAASSHPASPSYATSISLATRLFLDALELESGRRLSTWNHFILFLSKTQPDLQVAKSLLVQLIVKFKEDQNGDRMDMSDENTQSHDTTASKHQLHILQSNLALLQIQSATASHNGSEDLSTQEEQEEEEEAVLNLQDILASSSSASEDDPDDQSLIYSLTPMNNYAVWCMRSSDYTSAQKLFEFLLRHDPQNSTYWCNLAICYELQISLNACPLEERNEEESAGDQEHEEKKSAATTTSTLTRTPSALIAPTPSETAEQHEMKTIEARDVALRGNVRFCFERARFYESLLRPQVVLASASQQGSDRASAASSASATAPTASPSSISGASFASSPSSIHSQTHAASYASWSFRFNLASSFLQQARNDPTQMTRTQKYEWVEYLLQSIASEKEWTREDVEEREGLGKNKSSSSSKSSPLPISGRSEVYTVLGDLYSARSISALSEPAEVGGGSDWSHRFKLNSLAAYQQALELNPTNITAWNQLSILFLHSSDMKWSNTFLGRLMRRIKKNLGLEMSESDVESNKQQQHGGGEEKSQDATNAAGPSISYTPLTPSDLTRLGSSAITASSRVQLASVLCNYAVSLQLSSNPLSAEHAYLDSLRLASGHAPTYMNLGNLYRSLNRTDEALRCFSRALAIKPDYASAWCNASLVYIQKEDWMNAYHFMERANQHGAHLPSVQSNRNKLQILLQKVGFLFPIESVPTGQYNTVDEVNQAVTHAITSMLPQFQPGMFFDTMQIQAAGAAGIAAGAAGSATALPRVVASSKKPKARTKKSSGKHSASDSDAASSATTGADEDMEMEGW